LMLYTLSVAPREAFANFPMPREFIVRIGDVLSHPDYCKSAPYHFMPQGHGRVASYLAVAVISRDGSVHGGLFFGHSKPGVFTHRDELIVGGIAAQAAIAMDNARLFRESRRA